MRILNLSNLYPPQHLGGYELGCADLLSGLEEAGHETLLLCTYFGLESPEISPPVHRIFYNHRFPPARLPGLLSWAGLERRERRMFRVMAEGFGPDVIILWNLTGISPHVVLEAARFPCPVVHFISDTDNAQEPLESSAWFRYWRRDGGRPYIGKVLAPLVRLTGLTTSNPGLGVPCAVAVSRFIRDAALAAGRSFDVLEVLPWSVPVDRFRPPGEGPRHGGPLRFLYSGQLGRWKGVDTMLDALSTIAGRGPGAFRLTIAGEGHDADYDRSVRARCAKPPLEGCVRLAGRVPRDVLPDLYRQHDALIFPSEWQEPFSLTLVEAMASGLAVVSTLTGGTAEILKPEINGLAFETGNAADLARQVGRLMGDPALRARLGTKARETALAYDLAAMQTRFEELLRSLL